MNRPIGWRPWVLDPRNPMRAAVDDLRGRGVTLRVNDAAVAGVAQGVRHARRWAWVRALADLAGAVLARATRRLTSRTPGPVEHSATRLHTGVMADEPGVFFRNLPGTSYPFLILLFAGGEDEPRYTVRVTGPGIVEIPARGLGPEYRVRLEFADGTVLEATQDDPPREVGETAVVDEWTIDPDVGAEE